MQRINKHARLQCKSPAGNCTDEQEATSSPSEPSDAQMHQRKRRRKHRRREFLILVLGLCVFASLLAGAFWWRFGHEFQPCDVQDRENDRIIATAWAEVSTLPLEDGGSGGACDSDPKEFSSQRLPATERDSLVQRFLAAGWKLTEDSEAMAMAPNAFGITSWEGFSKRVRWRPLSASLTEFDGGISVTLRVEGSAF
ncbi:hypothetical protein GCM10010401_09670 [Rarobacter faecitabidus]|uniref:Uncharacterized protein n=3 Tax=Rarobacter faecitabidus TaxID=13243 RepID=A0A542ZA35_RARFA|nr:hypothetical protein FB461_2328 [Rarobacter faecitabidus]